MSTLTKYNSFKKLKSGSTSPAKSRKNRAAQVSELDAFFSLLQQKNTRKRKTNKDRA